MRSRFASIGLVGVSLGIVLFGAAGLASDVDELVSVDKGKKLARSSGRLKDTAYLLVTVEPPEATLNAGGTSGTGEVFARVKGPRWQLVKAEAPGYKTLAGYVELTAREVTRVRLKMERISGKITVVTNPPGAYIKLDDADAGRTPVTLDGLKPGVHGLSIEYGPFWWSKNVAVDPNRTVVVDLDMREKATPPPSPPSAGASTPPAPAPSPQHRSEPAPAASSEPELTSPSPPPPSPAPARAASSSDDGRKGKPNCRAVCARFVKAVSGSESLKAPIRNRCFERCESGDLKFSICAWKARVMQDVSVCMGLSE